MKKISLFSKTKQTRPPLRELRKLYFELEGPLNRDRLRKILKICKAYYKDGETRLAFEVTIKFIFD